MDATTPTPHQEVVETDKDYIDNESVSSQTSGSTSKRSSSEGSTRGHKSFVRDHLCQRGVVSCLLLQNYAKNKPFANANLIFIGVACLTVGRLLRAQSLGSGYLFPNHILD